MGKMGTGYGNVNFFLKNRPKEVNSVLKDLGRLRFLGHTPRIFKNVCFLLKETYANVYRF